MHKLLQVAVFVGLFISIFLLWPEVRYDLSCKKSFPGEINVRCDPEYIINYSDMRLGGGLAWIKQQDPWLTYIDKGTSSNYKVEYNEVVQSEYRINILVATIGSALIVFFIILTIFYLRPHLNRSKTIKKVHK